MLVIASFRKADREEISICHNMSFEISHFMPVFITLESHDKNANDNGKFLEKAKNLIFL